MKESHTWRVKLINAMGKKLPDVDSVVSEIQVDAREGLFTMDDMRECYDSAQARVFIEDDSDGEPTVVKYGFDEWLGDRER